MNVFPSIHKKELGWILAGTAPAVLFVAIFPDYLFTNTFFWVALLTLPLSVDTNGGLRYPVWIFGLAIGLVSLKFPSTIGLFMVMGILPVLLIQRYFGGISLTFLIHMMFLTPLFSYLTTLISFPLRIFLGKVVAGGFNGIGIPVLLEGNLVTYQDHSFLIDAGCAGLHLLGYGLLFGTIIISIQLRKKQVGIFRISGYYGILMVLILMSNVIRIMILILFRILPDQVMHEIMGLILFLLIVLIPFYWLVRAGSYKQPEIQVYERNRQFPVYSYWMVATLFVSLTILNLHRLKTVNTTPLLILEGFESEWASMGVQKLKNPDVLIYVKPPVDPYRADHNPLLCWQGSGYQFKKIKTYRINDVEVNFAELEKGEDRLYATWWFESDQSQTGSQWEWRRRALFHSEQFYLVNIACSTPEAAVAQTTLLMNKHLIALNYE